MTLSLLSCSAGRIASLAAVQRSRPFRTKCASAAFQVVQTLAQAYRVKQEQKLEEVEDEEVKGVEITDDNPLLQEGKRKGAKPKSKRVPRVLLVWRDVFVRMLDVMCNDPVIANKALMQVVSEDIKHK